METLGYTYKKPTTTKNGKWNYIDLPYNSSEDFNEATSKLVNILYHSSGTSDGKCLILDNKGSKYVVELIHATFDVENNSVRVLPHDCRAINFETRSTDRKPISKTNTKLSN